jgi:aspartyl-tRNA(Asn)/glutamyl-tRNA(Gln) amidotransferase subunit B
MELVTEPVIHSATAAGDFARELQLTLRTLGIAHVNMERGEMRVEANISVSSTDTLGTKVEVKNLNSFKSVEAAITYEIERQVALLEHGDVVAQETRGWDEVKQRTYLQRSKETAKDYRYFPDPDIPKIKVDEHIYFSRVNEKMKELPEEKRKKYRYIGLPINLVETIIQNDFLDSYFAEMVKTALEADVAHSVLLLAANYLTSDVVWLRGRGTPVNLSPQHFLEMMLLLDQGVITSRVAKDLLPEILVSNASPEAVSTERGLTRSADAGALLAILQQVVVNNESVVAEYRAGKAASLQFLIGQVMKVSKGTADPAQVREGLLKLLS